MWIVKPKIIEQPTWGRQTYELFSGIELVDGEQILTLDDLIKKNPEEVLGKRVWEKYGKMPLLVKTNRAKGNSFQIHIKPGIDDPRWKAKPESWYFMEDGRVTCGIKSGISVADYKNACEEVEKVMAEISKEVVSGRLEIDKARNKADELVRKINLWQFVQLRDLKKGEVMDVSVGGLHHSWEEVAVYEVQLDVMDGVSTIRAFDRGKIEDNGQIREVEIEDYFKYLDVSEETNESGFSPKIMSEKNLLTTNDYALDKLMIADLIVDNLNDSFGHYYIEAGKIKIENETESLIAEKGQSVFVPAGIEKVVISSVEEKSEVLKTYVPTN